MQQVADRARVSIATVSFVVNGTKPVSDETRDRILAAIDELGYRRNSAARALASRKSRVIALIYPLLDHRHHHSFVDAAATAAEERGYNLVLWPLHSDNVSREITSLIQSGSADGVILMEVQLDDERVDHLRRAEAPFALIGRTRETDGIDCVDIDFERSVEMAIDDLAAVGHRDFALIVEDLSGTPLAGYAPPIRSEQAFTEVIASRGLNGTVFRVTHDSEAVLALADDLARRAPQTTAIISVHDEAAFSLVMSLPRRGVRIPEDLSITGVATSTAMGDLLEPPLTVYDAPGSPLGRLATEALIARLEGSSAPPMLQRLACTLRPGESTGPAPADRAPLDRLLEQG
ncbi:LacI family DNA-binding transcriptional regulator [Humibacter albus]|uniref:LacI family DNA-binding transcriptional regulator n=1 Tax=Humibacter albus TaxID=427754 RepID=UPI000524D763|nr:LacI family DNA-binding transcriptional regulator [Humibacter albus]